MPSVGEVLPRLIADLGIDTVFGIPGVHTVELYRGLPESGVRHVTPRHEQGAGFMADGFARASGRPAACFIISGPGMTNVATAMGQAYADSVPMLVISSVLGRGELGRGEGRLHEMRDQGALAAGVAAWSRTVLTPDALPAALDRARATFRAARPRPVHIELPLDAIAAEAGDQAMPASGPFPPAPHPDAIARAAAMLRDAHRPMIVLGGGTVAAAEEARRLVEAAGAPTLLTIAAKGVLPPGHPLLIGSLLPSPAIQKALAAADIVVALGTELGETDTLLFGGRLRLHGRLIRIDIDAHQMTANVPATLGIVSDAGIACRALVEALDAPRSNGPDRARALRAAALDEADPAYRTHGRILGRIADAFPGIVIAGDSCQPVYGGNLTYDAPRPRSWFNSATGFGTLGYGLPAALGAKIARPDAPVAALIGDGGLQFTIAELATAVELRLPVPVVVWNNRGYGEIKTFMRDRQIPEIGVDILTPDFQTLARGFGARAAAPETPEALIQALGAAFAADGPTFVEIDEALAGEW